MNKWDIRFLQVARLVATWSKDPSTKVGAVIVNEDRRIIGTGYNGFPKGINDSDARLQNREKKLQLVVHAETNAILNCVGPVKGTILYCTFYPCPHCASYIIQAGIKRVVCLANSSDERYKESQEVSDNMFFEAGVRTEKYQQSIME